MRGRWGCATAVTQQELSRASDRVRSMIERLAEWKRSVARTENLKRRSKGGIRTSGENSLKQFALLHFACDVLDYRLALHFENYGVSWLECGQLLTETFSIGDGFAVDGTNHVS